MIFLKLILFLWMTSCSQESQTAKTSQAPVSSEKSQTTQTSQAPVSSEKSQTTQTSLTQVSFQEEDWISLEYSSLPAHQILFSPQKITIQVRKSSAPLIYPMTDSPRTLSQIAVKGKVHGLVRISPPEKQGDENFDDFNLRVGLVLLGNNTLRWFQRPLAASWVKQMFELAPEDQGIDHIYFLNAVLSPQKLNQKRTHPLSEYLKEEYVWLMNQTGEFSYTHTFPTPQEVGAFWISVDGDDTQSDFDIELSELSFQ